MATLPPSALKGVERYVPPTPGQQREVLLAENTRRARAGGQRDAGAATMILARFGPEVTARQRLVAEARAADPDAPWAEVAAKAGMTKDQAIGVFRRLEREATRWASRPS